LVWYNFDVMKILKKWDFWYWLLLILISIGGFYFYSEGDGRLGDAVLLMSFFFISFLFVGIYIVAKIGQILTQKILKNRKKS
jgi:hypothetical protein